VLRIRESKGRLLFLAAGFFLTSAFAGLHLFHPDIFVFLDNKIYDTFLKGYHQPGTSPLPVIVDLDEKSLDRFGQWPWPRYRIALLLDRIAAMGASSVGLDMVFAEPDRTSLGLLKEEMERDLQVSLSFQGLPGHLTDNDRILAESLARGPHVLGFEFLFDQDRQGARDCTLHPLKTSSHLRGEEGKAGSFFRAGGVICNVEVLAGAAASSGFLNATPDRDGILRRVPLVIEYHGELYPSLALSALMQSQEPMVTMVTSYRKRLESLSLGEKTVPLDPGGSLLLSFRGPRKSFDYVSAVDILDGTVTEEMIRGRIVLVGTTAAGLEDVRSTPLDTAFPGVEIHATALDNLLTGDFIRRPTYAEGTELLLIIILGLVSTLLLVWGGALWIAVILLVSALGLWQGARWLFFEEALYVSPLMPMVTLAGNFAVITLLKFRVEERRLRERTSELARTQDVIIQSLAALAETRDKETGGHIRRTQHYMKALAERLKDHPRFKAFLDKETIDLLFRLTALHDVGKVGVRDSILLKKGKLTPEEFEEMKKHTIYGSDTILMAEEQLGSNSFLHLAREVALNHQEKWDGTGYPAGLEGEEIPIPGRLMAVADVYDALISQRVYKKPMPYEEVRQIMSQGRGTHFDPDILDAFLEIEEEFRRIAEKFADPAQLGTPSGPADGQIQSGSKNPAISD
jgi:adenylate cyclase